MPVGSLLTIFGLLLGRATAVCTGNVFLFLGLCLHFVRALAVARPFLEDYASFENIVKAVLHVEGLMFGV